MPVIFCCDSDGCDKRSPPVAASVFRGLSPCPDGWVVGWLGSGDALVACSHEHLTRAAKEQTAKGLMAERRRF